MLKNQGRSMWWAARFQSKNSRAWRPNAGGECVSVSGADMWSRGSAGGQWLQKYWISLPKDSTWSNQILVDLSVGQPLSSEMLQIVFYYIGSISLIKDGQRGLKENPESNVRLQWTIPSPPDVQEWFSCSAAQRIKKKERERKITTHL